MLDAAAGPKNARANSQGLPAREGDRFIPSGALELPMILAHWRVVRLGFWHGATEFLDVSTATGPGPIRGSGGG
jgi:hypothetical protein